MTDGSQVFLHGNRIAWKLDNKRVAVTLAGWPTVTTRERLNAIMDIFGWEFSISQKDGNQVMSRPSLDRTRERVLTTIEDDQVITLLPLQLKTWGKQNWQQPPE